MEGVTSVMWFRRDLRLHDNPALLAAARGGPLVALFVIDSRLVHGRWTSPNRVEFMLRSLAALGRELEELGGQLCIRAGEPEHAVPKFTREAGATDVFVSRDYSPYARKRDADVARALAADGIAFHARRGTLVHEPEDILKNDGAPFGVFSPFLRRWSSLSRRAVQPAPAGLTWLAGIEPGDLPTRGELGLDGPAAELPPADEAAARERLDSWARTGLADYEATRDLLAVGGTSRLSHALRWGLLSPLEVAERCAGSPKFVSEIAWREFYYHVLWHHPRVTTGPYDERYGSIQWEDDAANLEAWKAGQTGVPIIDAAMRQLAATGFMPNRARMVVASFLVKDLLIDWREGERHFMRHLVDGDIASNNGGWQWAASTGTDAQPYFRVFNPYTQAARFDSDGEYVRRWVPELRTVPGPFVHRPDSMPVELQRSCGCIIGTDYPGPIVDHAEARARAIERFAAARGANGSG